MRLIDLVDLNKKGHLWELRDLIKNPNISFEECKKLAELFGKEPIEYNFSANPNITVSDIINNKSYNWDIDLIAENSSIILDLIKYDIGYGSRLGMGRNQNITYSDFQELLPMILKDKRSNRIIYNFMMYNKNLPIDIVIDYQLKNPNLELWANICWHPGFTLDLIIKYQTYLTNHYYYDLSSNKHITVDFILANLDKEWNWNCLTHTMELSDIIANPNLPWKHFNFHPKMKLDYLIKNNLINDTDWLFGIANLPTIQIEYILENKHLPWDWDEVSGNPNLTPDIITANPDIMWNESYLSDNHMTFDPIVYNKHINNYIKTNMFIITGVSGVINNYV